MAKMMYTLHKNDGGGVSKEFAFAPESTFPDAAILFNESTLEFVEWNASADGTSTSYFTGDMIPGPGSYYAIWGASGPVPYLVTDQDLTAIANAIRAKGGTSAPLAFPDEFVDAIGDIQTGPAAHTVTVKLSYPVNPGDFGSCILLDGGESGEQVGEITSATGSATVTVSSGILCVKLTGGNVHVSNLLASYQITGNIGVNGYQKNPIFIVGSDGSVEIYEIDWDF